MDVVKKKSKKFYLTFIGSSLILFFLIFSFILRLGFYSEWFFESEYSANEKQSQNVLAVSKSRSLDSELSGSRELNSVKGVQALGVNENSLQNKGRELPHEKPSDKDLEVLMRFMDEISVVYSENLKVAFPAQNFSTENIFSHYRRVFAKMLGYNPSGGSTWNCSQYLWVKKYDNSILAKGDIAISSQEKNEFLLKSQCDLSKPWGLKWIKSSERNNPFSIYKIYILTEGDERFFGGDAASLLSREIHCVFQQKSDKEFHHYCSQLPQALENGELILFSKLNLIKKGELRRWALQGILKKNFRNKEEILISGPFQGPVKVHVKNIEEPDDFEAEEKKVEKDFSSPNEGTHNSSGFSEEETQNQTFKSKEFDKNQRNSKDQKENLVTPDGQENSSPEERIPFEGGVLR